MRINLVLTTLLFLLPSNINCSSKEEENKNSSLETENLPNIDVSNGLNIEYINKTSGPAVKIVERREAGVLIDDNDYEGYPLCGDKPMDWGFTCYCGNRTLSGYADLRDGDHYCCVLPFADGQDQCEYIFGSDVPMAR